MTYHLKPPDLYHYSADKRIRGRVIKGTRTNNAYIYDNKTNEVILVKQFNFKEVRQANIWLYEHLDCPLFTLLQSLPKQT